MNGDGGFECWNPRLQMFTYLGHRSGLCFGVRESWSGSFDDKNFSLLALGTGGLLIIMLIHQLEGFTKRGDDSVAGTSSGDFSILLTYLSAASFEAVVTQQAIPIPQSHTFSRQQYLLRRIPYFLRDCLVVCMGRSRTILIEFIPEFFGWLFAAMIWLSAAMMLLHHCDN